MPIPAEVLHSCKAKHLSRYLDLVLCSCFRIDHQSCFDSQDQVIVVNVLRETTPSSMAASRFKYLTTALERILFSSVVMVLAFGVEGLWFKSRPNLVFPPCIYSFVSLLRTFFIRNDISICSLDFSQQY